MVLNPTEQMIGSMDFICNSNNNCNCSSHHHHHHHTTNMDTLLMQDLFHSAMSLSVTSDNLILVSRMAIASHSKRRVTVIFTTNTTNTKNSHHHIFRKHSHAITITVMDLITVMTMFNTMVATWDNSLSSSRHNMVHRHGILTPSYPLRHNHTLRQTAHCMDCSRRHNNSNSSILLTTVPPAEHSIIITVT